VFSFLYGIIGGNFILYPKKFDKAQIELLILSKKYRQHKKRLAESLLTELRKIFYGSASIY